MSEIRTHAKCDECYNMATVRLDARYMENLCTFCYSSRRNEAARAGDFEWFSANGLLGELTNDEKAQIGY